MAVVKKAIRDARVDRPIMFKAGGITGKTALATVKQMLRKRLVAWILVTVLMVAAPVTFVLFGIALVFSGPVLRAEMEAFYSDRGWTEGSMDTSPVPAVIPGELAYQPVDPAFIVSWLKARNSALATSRFAWAVIAAGREYDVNSLLLVAITGQEQSFVPDTAPAQDRIAMNPFNVFGGWHKTRIPIETSANIAARTVARLSRDRPPGVHPIKWVNGNNFTNPGGVYATDQLWYRGVTRFFEQLQQDHAVFAGKIPSEF